LNSLYQSTLLLGGEASLLELFALELLLIVLLGSLLDLLVDLFVVFILLPLRHEVSVPLHENLHFSL
jgi:hypothetical protein